METIILAMLEKWSDKWLKNFDAKLKAGPLTGVFARLEPFRTEIEEALTVFISVVEFETSAKAIPFAP